MDQQNSILLIMRPTQIFMGLSTIFRCDSTKYDPSLFNPWVRSEKPGTLQKEMTPVAAAAEMDVKLEIKLEAPEPATPSREIVHTRSCNGRKICSCILRLESAYFHKQLAKKQREASKKARPALASVGNGKSKRSARAQLVVVKNLKDFSIEFKQHIASFLSGVDLAMLGMVSLPAAR